MTTELQQRKRVNSILTDVPQPGSSVFGATVEYLQKYITENNLSPGDQLPTQKEIQEQFGVSRPVLREAIKYLESCGLLVSFQGKGVFVANPNLSSVINPMRSLISTKIIDLDGLFEVRFILEPQIAKKACERCTEVQLELLWENIEQSKTHIYEKEKFVADDMMFHELLAKIGGNPIFLIWINPIIQLMGQYQFYQVPELAVKWHTSIYESIRAKDPLASQNSMLEHLEGVRRLFSEDALNDQYKLD